jgi:glycosyltransferase involved in cell wall biosynthesis
MKEQFYFPFDQYKRYRLISDIINKFRNNNEKFKIIDVGAGFEENLQKFLPDDDIYYMDKEYPPEYLSKGNFILGDIIEKEFDEKFDFVVSVDAYEHISQSDREKFIEILISLSEIATIVAAPFDQEDVQKCEIFANEIYKINHGSDYIWFKEHITNGLPSLPATLDLIRTHNLNCVKIPNGYLPRWFLMMSSYLLTENRPASHMMSELAEFYNRHFYQYDNRNPAYRQAIVIIKSDTFPDFSDLLSTDVPSDDLVHLNQLLHSFIAKIEKIDAVDKDNLGIVPSKRDLKIQELTNLVQTAEQLAGDRAARIDQLTEQVHAAEQLAGDRAARIDQLTGQAHAADLKIAEITTENWALKNDLSGVKDSINYNLMEMFQMGIIERFFPPESKRRQDYNRFLMGSRILATKGLRNFTTTFQEYRKTKRRFAVQQPPGRAERGSSGEIKEKEKQYIDEIFARVGTKSDDYVPLSDSAVVLREDDIKLIAFYLPQFHPIPENDIWWGKGFTDWINVAKAVPLFPGHYQPHLPDELGFYDLRVKEVQKRQIELARQYGLYGFCFHYYWFEGKRLLEMPLDHFIDNDESEFPFCICWANENWTRRWDGKEKDILITQTHSPENDLAFIKDLERYLRDSRYIRINGKLVLIVYQVSLLPDPRLTAEIWRTYCKEQGIGELYLVAAQTFGIEDPCPFGFDAAVEFPPHHPLEEFCDVVNNQFTFMNPRFSGEILDMEPYIISKKFQRDVPYTLFKTVSPGWDNTPRRFLAPKILYGLNPANYGEWLSGCIEYTNEHHDPGEHFVFINAWNEWAEGAHLEPDKKYGYSYLQKTANAILRSREVRSAEKKIIVVSHDALRYGAQLIALNLVMTLKTHFKYDVCVLLKAGGPLESEFEKYSRVINIEQIDHDSVQNIIKGLSDQGFSIALCNSIATGDLSEIFAGQGIKTVVLIHELPGIIRDYGLEENSFSVSRYADRIVFPSEFVKTAFGEIYPIDDRKAFIAPQGLYFKNRFRHKKDEARIELRKLLHLPEHAQVILGVGSADYRKGADLFFEVSQKIIAENPLAYFIWVGIPENTLISLILEKIAKSNLQERIQFIGQRTEDLDLFYAGSDLFLIPSREDPFPSVVMEAMDAGLPVVGFENAGGFYELISSDRGILTPYLDTDEMADAVRKILTDGNLKENLGKKASNFIQSRCKFLDYAYRILSATGQDYKKVSVILPNYNHGHYLKGRIESIGKQSYPIYEVIFLDDCSIDKSVEIMQKIVEDFPLDIKIVRRSTNSGSIFRQWSDGISLALGDYIWVTEADDYALPDFLVTAMQGFDDEGVVLSYTQSRQIDEKGDQIEPDYLKYTNDIDSDKWCRDYVADGISEISRSLVIKNTIPNVSGTVFRKFDITEIVPEITKFKVCGDWRFYVWLLQKGKIAYFSEPLNLHRRYAASVTGTTKAQQHFREIVAVQDFIMDNFEINEEVKDKVYRYRDAVYRYLMDPSYSS